MDRRGIEVAAILGMVGGDPDKKLEVIAGVTDEDREECRRLNEAKICDVNLAENVPNLYIEDHHGIRRAYSLCTYRKPPYGYRLYAEGSEDSSRYRECCCGGERRRNRTRRSKQDEPQGILEYADTVDLEDIKPVIQRQIEMNSRISQEGLDNAWGCTDR